MMLFYKYLVDNLAKISVDIDLSEMNESTQALYNDYLALIAKTHSHVTNIMKKDTLELADVRYIEEEIIPQFIKVGPIHNKYKTRGINDFQILTHLLKLKIVSAINEPTNSKAVSDNLLAVFKLIAGFGDLDKAETYQSMLSLMQASSTTVSKHLEEGTFKDMYNLFSNSVKKYTLVNYEKQYVEVDAVSFINELQQYYNRNNPSIFELYLTLGLNQNLFFGGSIPLPDSDRPINNIGFASEKLGVKIRISNFYRYRDYEYAIKSDVSLNRRAPFINEFYVVLYGSGLLYNIANTTTNSKFNYAHVGVAPGIRFYNALDLNVTIGFPFIRNANPFRNAFVGLALDIPLGEYLEKLGNKK